MFLATTIPSLLILAPILVGAIFFKRLPKVAKVLWLFILLTAVMDAVSITLAYNRINNLWLFHLYSYFEFGFISFIYLALIKTRKVRVFILLMMILFLASSLINVIAYEGILVFNSLQRHIEGFILVIYGVHYLMEITKDKNQDSSIKNPYYLLTVGFLMYFCGTLYLFIYGNTISENGDWHYWLLHTFFHSILLIIYTMFFWRVRIR